MQPLEYKNIAILGAAGSGLAVAGLLKKNNYQIFVSEQKPQEPCREAVDRLKRLKVDFELKNISIIFTRNF